MGLEAPTARDAVGIGPRLGRWLGPTFGDLPEAFWFVFAGVLVNRLGGFVLPFLVLYLVEAHGFGIAKAGLMASLVGVGSIFAGPIGGQLADSIGRRPALVLSLTLSGGCMIGFAFLRAPAAIAVAAVALGFAVDLFRAPVLALVADFIPPRDRVRASGLMFWAANVGEAIAAVGAGFVASRSFFALFVVDGLTTLVFAALVRWKVPDSRAPRARAATAADASTLGYGVVLRDGVFLALLGSTLPVLCLLSQGSSTLGLDMRAQGLSKAAFGAAIAVSGCLVALLQPAAARICQRHDRPRALALASLLVGAGCALNAWAEATWSHACAVGVSTLGAIILLPVANSLVSDLAPPAARGRYQGGYLLIWGVACLVGPSLGTLVLDRLGARTLWLSCGAVGLVAAQLHLITAGPQRRRLARLAELGEVVA